VSEARATEWIVYWTSVGYMSRTIAARTQQGRMCMNLWRKIKSTRNESAGKTKLGKAPRWMEKRTALGAFIVLREND
jgi:hypothetical protein